MYSIFGAGIILICDYDIYDYIGMCAHNSLHHSIKKMYINVVCAVCSILQVNNAQHNTTSELRLLGQFSVCRT